MTAGAQGGRSWERLPAQVQLDRDALPLALMRQRQGRRAAWEQHHPRPARTERPSRVRRAAGCGDGDAKASKGSPQSGPHGAGFDIISFKFREKSSTMHRMIMNFGLKLETEDAMHLLRQCHGLQRGSISALRLRQKPRLATRGWPTMAAHGRVADPACGTTRLALDEETWSYPRASFSGRLAP